MKLNDWIVAGINNPSFDNNDFKDIGLNLENTQILPIEDYLKTDFVKNNPNFLDSSGVFLETRFRDYYNSRIGLFKDFAEDTNYLAFLYDLFDPRNLGNGRVKDPKLRTYSVSNPLHVTKGTSGVTEIGVSGLTAKEQAQKNKVFNPETGKFEDYTPNDYALFNSPLNFLKSIFTTDSLVYALYDEDGIHIDPITGELVQHKKGDFKLNPEGEYYTEKLNSRSPNGKTFVSTFDTITIDESPLNKYDFFDADSADKSIAGSLASTAATVAPLFLGPEVAAIYSAALISRELSKALPMLGGFVDMFLGTDLGNSSIFNSLSGKALLLTGGTSEYSTQNQLTFENISKIVADVATQWGQQKAIAQGLNRIKSGTKALLAKAYENAGKKFIELSTSLRLAAMISGDKKATEAFYKNTGLSSLDDKALEELLNSGKWTETALGKAAMASEMKAIEPILEKLAKIGARASLAYMALISNTDVYQDMIEAGATKKEAALVALGSTLGMYAVDRTGIGELFFDDLTAVHTKQVRSLLKNELASWQQTLNSTIKNPNIKGPNKLLNLIGSGRLIGSKVLSNYWDDIRFHTTGFVGKAVGEGLEEVSEEIVSDLAKQLYEIAGAFGIASLKDVGAWKNFGTRAGMSFLGGALGGGIFYGAGVVNGQYPLNIDNSDLLYLVRNGRTQEIRDQINTWKKLGKFGSVDLSATKYHEDDDGNRTYLTADTKEDSLNDFIANQILHSVDLVDAIINANQLNLSEDLLFDQMVLSEVRYQDLREWLQDESYSYGYQREFLHIVEDLVLAQTELNAASKTKSGTISDTSLITDPERRNLEGTVEGEQRKASLAELQLRVEDLKKRRDLFLSGDTSLRYTRKMLFALDLRLSARFADTTLEQFIFNNHHKKLEQLTETELLTYLQEYDRYRENERRLKLDEEFEKFLKLEPILAIPIQNLEENAKAFKPYYSSLPLLHEILGMQPVQLTDTIEGDTPELIEVIKNAIKQYNEVIKNKKKEDYTSEDLEAIDIINKRAEQIDTYNNKVVLDRYLKIFDWLTLVDGKIDPITFRDLWKSLDVNKVLIKNSIIEKALELVKDNLDQVSILTNATLFLLILKEKINSLSKETKDEILSELFGYIEEDIKSNLLLHNLWANLFVASEAGGKVEEPTLGYFEDLRNLLNQEIENNKTEIFADAITEEDHNKAAESYVRQYILEHSDADVANNQEYIDYIYDLITGAEKYVDLNSKSKLEETAKELSKDARDFIGRIINDAINSINSNIHLKAYDLLSSAVTRVNPFVNFIKQALSALGEEDATKIEEVLLLVFDSMENLGDYGDFRLTPEQIELFNKTKNILDLIEGYLYAASSSATLLTPYGHNKTINEFFNNHKDAISKFNELPELSDETYSLYLSEFAKYKNLIDLFILLSNKNAINKTRKFKIADEKFVEARKLFFEVNKDAFVITLSDGKVYNLLDGVEKLTPGSNPNEKTIYINKVELLLYDNIQLLLANGITFKEILDTGIIKKLITDSSGKTDIEELLNVPLDENITYDSLTNYDKVIYFLTVASLGVSDWNQFNLTQIQKYPEIIPLTIQLYVARIAVAKYNNPSIFNAGLLYLSDENLINDKLNRLDNITFISGIAGAGKSSICGKWVVDWANLHGVDQDDIWLTAPEKLQIDNLKKSVVLGNSILKSDLFKKLFNLDLVDNHTALKEVLELDVSGNTIVKVNLEKYPLTATKLPKLLVIDEGTYFSNEEYLLLNSIGVNIVVLGDPNLNGYQAKEGNIDREFCFVTRTPKLEISLRDNNLLNQNNQLATSNLLSEISSVKERTPEAVLKSLDFIKAIGKLQYRVYMGDDINGTLITRSLTLSTIDLIPKTINGNPVSIGYIGATDSANYKKLVNAGFSPEAFGDVTKVLGQEFDYIFIDDQISLVKPSEDVEIHAFNYFVELRKIYTLMSRGKIASIFIDPNGILQSLVGKNQIDSFKATAPSLKEAADTFRGPFLEMLTTLVLEVTPKTITKPDPKAKPAEEGTSEEISGEEGTDEGSSEEPTEDLKGEEEDFDEEPTSKDPVPEEEVSFPDEIANDLANTDVNLNDVPVYSKFSLVGVPVRIDTVKNKLGEDIQVQSWLKPTGSKRDIGIFMDRLINDDNLEGNLDVTADPYKDNPSRVAKDRNMLINSLLLLKSALLFKTPYDQLPQSIRYRFSLKDLESVKYKIEIKKKTDQDFTTGGMEEATGINGVLINVVAEIKKEASGETVYVTMGALADPQTHKDLASEYVASLQKSIARFHKFLDQEEDGGTLTKELRDSIDKRIKFLLDRIDNNKDINTKYETDISNLIELFRKNGEEPMYFDTNVHSSLVTSTESPRSAPMLQLDILKQDYQGKMIISKPYIVGKKFIPGVSKSMAGKAVVFVSAESSNVGATSDSLLNDYLKLRTAIVESGSVEAMESKGNSPKVRMLVLSSRAYDLDSLLRHETPEDTPFAWRYIGRKMLVSTWNFRANLLNFIDLYENFDFLVPEGQDKDSYIEKVALASALIYKANTDGTPELLEQLPKEVINPDNTLTEEAKIVERRILDFNNSLASEVKDFRLGGAINGTQYISKLTNISEGNKFYNLEKGPIYGIYLGINRAKKFKDLLNALFSTLEPVLTLKDSEGKPLDEKFIVSGKDKSSNNINNFDPLLTGHIEFDDGVEIEFGSNKLYSIFSTVLLKILRKVWYSLDLKEQLEEEIDSNPTPDPGINVTIKSDEGTQKYNLSVFNIIGNLDTFDPDFSFSDMFKLIIHGTTDNITENPNSPKAYSAYFKRGIMMDPIKVPHSGIDYGTDTAVFFEAANPDYMFLVDRVPTSPVFRVSTSDLETFSKEGPKIETDSWKDKLRNKIPDQFKEELESMLEYESATEQEVKEELYKSILNSIHDELSRIFNSDTKILGNTIVGCDQDFNTTTLNLYLELKGISPLLEYILTEKEIILDNRLNKQVISYNNISKSIEIETLQSDADDNDKVKKEGLKNAILKLAPYIEDEDATGFFKTLDEFEDYDSLKNGYERWYSNFSYYLEDLSLEIDGLDELINGIETLCK